MKYYLFFLLMGLISISTALAQSSEKNNIEKDRIDRARDYFGDERLIDQNGVEHRFYSDLLHNHVVLINVIFAHCQDACPLQAQKLLDVRQKLENYFGSEIMFLSLTIDPKRDSPSALKLFAQKQHADLIGWKFLTGEERVIEKVLRRLNQWTNDPTNHSTLLIAGNARRAHWIKLRPDSPPERIAEDLLRLVKF